MGILKWFQRGPKRMGTSPGGSSLLSYDDNEDKPPRIGFSDKDMSGLQEKREALYTEMFGECDIVLHEMLPLVPHVDVYRHPATEKRPFVTYVTGGMSGLPMRSPRDLGREWRRVELVFYTAEARDDVPGLLRQLAHFPHENATWIHWGHTMPNGVPPSPIFDDSPELDTLFFMPSIVHPEAKLEERLSWEGDPVKLVWVVPISQAECSLKLEQGSDAVYELFEQHDHPFIFNPGRKSYV